MPTAQGGSPLVTREFSNGGRGRSPLLSALVAALVVAIVVVGTVISRGGDSPAPSEPTSPAVADLSNQPLPEQDPSKVRSPSDEDWLTGAPAGLVWCQEDSIALPFTAADGPRSVDETSGAATGYSRTPQGAMVAAYQIATRIALGTHYAEVVDAQTVFDAEAAADVKQHRGSPDPSALGDVHPSAFKVLAYLSSQATVQYALPNPFDGSYNSYQFTVIWTHDDWKLVAPSDTAAAQTLSSIDGFTPF